MSNSALVNMATLDELGGVVGREKLGRMIERFVATLATSFDGEGREGPEIGREAHTLVSMAGMLGCDALFEACRSLEYAAKDGTDLTAPLGEVRTLRDRTMAELRRHWPTP